MAEREKGMIEVGESEINGEMSRRLGEKQSEEEVGDIDKYLHIGMKLGPSRSISYLIHLVNQRLIEQRTNRGNGKVKVRVRKKWKREQWKVKRGRDEVKRVRRGWKRSK